MAAGNLAAAIVDDNDIVGGEGAIRQIVGGDGDQAGGGIAGADIALRVGDQPVLGGAAGKDDHVVADGARDKFHR